VELFPSQEVNFNSDVDEGTTVMDYMQQERQRGITIRAAAITFNWNDFHINLIDTPGHVDFSGEVERSLRVMDGCVVVLDGVNGIQTQTESVWKQASKYHCPKIVFINKLDLHGASPEIAVHQLKVRYRLDSISGETVIVALSCRKGADL
jgi:elongation factor G